VADNVPNPVIVPPALDSPLFPVGRFAGAANIVCRPKSPRVLNEDELRAKLLEIRAKLIEDGVDPALLGPPVEEGSGG